MIGNNFWSKIMNDEPELKNEYQLLRPGGTGPVRPATAVPTFEPGDIFFNLKRCELFKIKSVYNNNAISSNREIRTSWTTAYTLFQKPGGSMESRHCGQGKRIFFCPVHNASTPCSLQAFGSRCIRPTHLEKRHSIWKLLIFRR